MYETIKKDILLPEEDGRSEKGDLKSGLDDIIVISSDKEYSSDEEYFSDDEKDDIPENIEDNRKAQHLIGNCCRSTTWDDTHSQLIDMFKNIVDMKQHHVEESVSDEVSELRDSRNRDSRDSGDIIRNEIKNHFVVNVNERRIG
nr:hypothetical protein [Tanacetum cinerariifolium]